MISEIRGLLQEHTQLPVDAATLGDDDDLYEAGLSSHDTVHLMLAIEEEFDIEFPDDMLNRKSFESISSIRAAVSRLVSEKSSA